MLHSFLCLVVAIVGFSACAEGHGSPNHDSKERQEKRSYALDLRNEFSPKPIHLENARIYKEPFGSVMYWGPKTLGKWAEVRYRFDFPFAVETIDCGLKITVYNRNLKPNFDDAAQGTIDVSGDGANWLRLYSSNSLTGVKQNPEVFRKIRGVRTVFLKARLFAARSLNGHQVQIAQFIRSDPEKGHIPVFSAVGVLSNNGTDVATESFVPPFAIGNNPIGRTVFPDWQKFVVHQRRSRTGCIPTGYEMLLRAAGITSVNYARFQDDFDLDVNLGRARTVPRNNFISVAAAVRLKYPFLHFEQKSFAKGKDKVAFIDDCLSRQRPILLSLTQLRSGRPSGWHIMPIVDARPEACLLLRFVRKDGTPVTEWINKSTIAEIHDKYEGGKEIAFLKTKGLGRAGLPDQ